MAKRVMAFMREAGCEVEAVVMKTDNEPAFGEGGGRTWETEGIHGVEEEWWWNTTQSTASRVAGTPRGQFRWFRDA